MITKEQFGLWKHEPVTKWFFDYLINKQAFLKSAALDMWLSDPKLLTETVRGQVIELEEIIELPHEAIEAFYKERDEIHGDDRLTSKETDKHVSENTETAPRYRR